MNWDPALHTAISDLEVENREEQGHMWHFRYPLSDGSGHLVVATTRPETMLGDTAVAVPPDDPDAFTAAVEYLAGDVELRTRMGVNARAWAEKCHSARVAAGSYLDLVGRLTDP